MEAQSSGTSNVSGRRGSSVKEHQERRARLLADLGDGMVLIAWANTGVEEVSVLHQIQSKVTTGWTVDSLCRNNMREMCSA